MIFFIKFLVSKDRITKIHLYLDCTCNKPCGMRVVHQMQINSFVKSGLAKLLRKLACYHTRSLKRFIKFDSSFSFLSGTYLALRTWTLWESLLWKVCALSVSTVALHYSFHAVI